MNNENFNYPEFEGIKKEAGLNRFTISAKQWVEKTNAIGIMAKSGRYGGTYAHKDIAYHFGMWLSPQFHLLIVKEFDRLKAEEAERKQIGWDFQRFLSKVNYKLQTDSVKDIIIPKSKLPDDKKWLEYAEEADLINIAVLEQTAKQWRETHPDDVKAGRNIRDLADLYQLNVISNLEVINSNMIRKGLSRQERLIALRNEAIYELESLYKGSSYTQGQIQSPFTDFNQTGYVEYQVVEEQSEEKLSEFNKMLKQTFSENNPNIKDKGEN